MVWVFLAEWDVTAQEVAMRIFKRHCGDMKIVGDFEKSMGVFSGEIKDFAGKFDFEIYNSYLPLGYDRARREAIGRKLLEEFFPLDNFNLEPEIPPEYFSQFLYGDGLLPVGITLAREAKKAGKTNYFLLASGPSRSSHWVSIPKCCAEREGLQLHTIVDYRDYGHSLRATDAYWEGVYAEMEKRMNGLAGK